MYRRLANHLVGRQRPGRTALIATKSSRSLPVSASHRGAATGDCCSVYRGGYSIQCAGDGSPTGKGSTLAGNGPMSSSYHSGRFASSSLSLSRASLAASRATSHASRWYRSSSPGPSVPSKQLFSTSLAEIESQELVEALVAYDTGQVQQSYRDFRRVRGALERSKGQPLEDCVKPLVLSCIYTALFRSGEYKEARRFAAEILRVSNGPSSQVIGDAAAVCDIRAALEGGKTAENGKFGVEESVLQGHWEDCGASQSLGRPSRLVELHILQTAMAVYRRGAAMGGNGENWEAREGGEGEIAVGLPSSFFELMKDYNRFLLKYAASQTERKPSDPGADPDELMLTAERFAKRASLLLEQNITFLSDTTPFADLPSSPSAPQISVGELAERITRKELAAEFIRGITLLHTGMGTALMREANVFASNYSGAAQRLHEVGEKVLKDGLALCKKYAYIKAKHILPWLLSSLATSFSQQLEPVLSEGLFRSSLNEFTASTGLSVQTFSAAKGAAAGGGEGASSGTLTAYPRQAELDDIVEFGVTCLRYSDLLKKWDGREYEAELMRNVARKALGIRGHPTSGCALWDIPARLHVFSLLWKPSVCLARPLLVYVAGRDGNENFMDGKNL
ncbi:hypothetical protein BESB_055790 [Besnoitia besnoiti]|uniref:Uncharacterized protein n=1 Tax=Besnoitia besnoiti TaxID=94643 RepID=A0A2A9MBR8_BESBE|nr:hypothetical protein BESB_055790 [Besnoitia besnoiti]PFH35928.1 hypothetical protein BESB_055790 [Besnoitia besnoiti]